MTEYTREQAEALPLVMRVRAYAYDTGKSAPDATAELVELGLQKLLEDRLLLDPNERPPIYLWASYVALAEQVKRET